MNLLFDTTLAEGYKNKSQQVRVLSEEWVGRQVFCPNCGYSELNKHKNNKPVSDFYCLDCNEDYELKSKQGSIGKKIVDGAYKTMIKRLQSTTNPNLFLLSYDPNTHEVSNFLVIPKRFFVSEIIEKRKPLSPSARRPNWVGCNIALQKIPESGKVFFIRNREIVSKENTLKEWKRTLFLSEDRELSAKGWLLDVMKYVEIIGKREFSLNDIYAFERELQVLHPANKHIKDKIRQQLQVLRDNSYLDFVSRGQYRIT